MVEIFFQYLTWQYLDAPKEILKGWRNFLLFNLNFFSFPLLLKTLFSHWRRYRASYGKGFSPWRYFETFIFNMMSRIIGAVLRLFLLGVGIGLEVLIILIGAIIFLGWLILPFLLVFGIIFGFERIL